MLEALSCGCELCDVGRCGAYDRGGVCGNRRCSDIYHSRLQRLASKTGFDASAVEGDIVAAVRPAIEQIDKIIDRGQTLLTQTAMLRTQAMRLAKMTRAND